MANTYTTLNDLFTGIADAIRLKNGNTGKIVADNFPTEIGNLRTGFDYNNQNVTEIVDYQFRNCTDLRSVDCANLESVGVSAFEGCSNLKSIVIYEGVINIGENAFKGCSNTIIYCMFDSQPETWSENWNPDGCEVVYLGKAVETWDISNTKEDNVTAKLYNDIHNEGYYSLVISGSGNIKDFQDSSYVPWNSYRKNINSVTIPEGVTSIGNYVFYDCISLTSIIIPNSVTSIGYEVFAYCESLTSVNMPDGVTSIGKDTFRDCSSLTSITIPNSVTSIGYEAFFGCKSLTSVIIPDSVTSIGFDAFYYCTSLTSVILSESITSISSLTFASCKSLESITIPYSVTSIGGSAFSSCTSLTSIDMPNSVRSIGRDTFYNCSALISVNYIGTIAQWNTMTFGDYWNHNTGNYTIYCTDGTIAKDGTITYYSTTGGEG